MKNILTIFTFILASLFSTAQNAKADSTVSTYLHIKRQSFGYDQGSDLMISFVLTNIDSSGNANWKSQEIKEFEREEDEYFVKANIPLYVANNSSQIWCTAKTLRSQPGGYDTIEMKYGGVKMSNIKLVLKSSPEGAETYLIPNRIWLSDFKNFSFDKDDARIQKYRVNTSSTNTYAYVDETVFVVMFKMNNTFKKVIHSTKPYDVEQEQTVWINF